MEIENFISIMVDTTVNYAYIKKEMSWRRNKKGKNNTVAVSQPNPAPSVPAPDSSAPFPVAVGVYHETKPPSILTDALKGAIEKAANRIAK